MYNDAFLQDRLREREENDSVRQLVQLRNCVDFSSNDYLGIASKGLNSSQEIANSLHGSGGSRTLSGNYPLIEETEDFIAKFHQAAAGLIFNSGYCANLGIMSCVSKRGDTVIYDFLAHASLRDGIRLSRADAFSFRHNDMEDLEKRLAMAKGNIFVVTESLFSMDGDTAPLAEIIALCEKYHAHLIVDEAHATGIIGSSGEGLVQTLGLQDRVFARIHTFGKAIGCHGAIILGSQQLKSYLINFARSFIFTTALSPSAVSAILLSYKIFPGMVRERNHLQVLSDYFNDADLPFEKLISNSPVKAVIIPGNTTVKSAAQRLQEHGYDVRPILYPTVPRGRERLRINLHAFNSLEELRGLVGELCH
jgi:8-amino-7-oxononanoate synthase